MLKLCRCGVILAILFLVPTSAFPQGEIVSITFDEIPPETTFGGTESVKIQADTEVNGNLVATGEMEVGAGVRYSDGTLQTTAGGGASGAQGLTANQGFYSNKIPDITPPNAYTEVCFKNGIVTSDIHAGGSPTSGGNCEPGDTGWIIERFERSAAIWTLAKAECLMDGLRLPEPFEWQFACMDAASLAIDSMTGAWEWSSNTSLGHSLVFKSVSSVATSIMGLSGCNYAAHAAVARSDGIQPGHAFRCAR